MSPLRDNFCFALCIYFNVVSNWQAFQTSLATDFWSCSLKYLIQTPTKLCKEERITGTARPEIKILYSLDTFSDTGLPSGIGITNGLAVLRCNFFATDLEGEAIFISCNSWADMGDLPWVELSNQDTTGRLLCLIFYLKISHCIAYYLTSSSENSSASEKVIFLTTSLHFPFL